MTTGATILRVDEAQRLKGHSPCTKRSYQAIVALFVEHFRGRTVTPEGIRRYFLHLEDPEGEHCYKPRTLNLHQDALRFMFTNVLHKPRVMDDISHVRTNKPLPRIHSKEKILEMVEATRNPKHRLLIGICYGCGLRVSELVTLRVYDFDWDRKVLMVKDNAKGEKHRRVPLYPCRELFDVVTHGQGQLGYVFQGQKPNEPYSARSAQKDYVRACRRVGIVPTGIHTLRHSFITHLLEAGHNVATVAEIVGHSDVRTTQRYTHLSIRHIESVKSPMEDTRTTPRAGLCEVCVG